MASLLQDINALGNHLTAVETNMGLMKQKMQASYQPMVKAHKVLGEALQNMQQIASQAQTCKTSAAEGRKVLQRMHEATQASVKKRSAQNLNSAKTTVPVDNVNPEHGGVIDQQATQSGFDLARPPASKAKRAEKIDFHELVALIYRVITGASQDPIALRNVISPNEAQVRDAINNTQNSEYAKRKADLHLAVDCFTGKKEFHELFNISLGGEG